MLKLLEIENLADKVATAGSCGGVSGGVIAAVAVGVALAMLVALLVFFVFRARRKSAMGSGTTRVAKDVKGGEMPAIGDSAPA